MSYAYTTNNSRDHSVSAVTGFYECVQTCWYGQIPLSTANLVGRPKQAWLIKGQEYDLQPSSPTEIPPIAEFLGRKMYHQSTLWTVSRDDFMRMRQEILNRQLDSSLIHPLGRPPNSEMELFAIVLANQKALGIERILKAQQAFPDLLVEIAGRQIHIELERNSKSFMRHRHHEAMENGTYKYDGRPVAILCWIDDDAVVRRYVRGVYEVSSLIRLGRKICW